MAMLYQSEVDDLESILAHIPAARRVLVAGEDRSLRDLMSGALLRAGFSVVECPSAGALVEFLLGQAREEFVGDPLEPIDLIVFDIGSGEPGLTALERLWALPLPPIVLISEFGDLEVDARARRLAAAAVLTKPVDPRHAVILADWLAVRGQRSR